MKNARPVPVWILRVLALLGILLCIPPAIFGAFLLLTDATDDPGGDWDGFGLVLGGGLLAICLVVMIVLGVAALLLFLRPRAGLVMSAVLAVLTGVASVALYVVDDGGWLAGLAVWGGGACAVLGLAIWGLVPGAARTSYAESVRMPPAP